MIWNSLVLTSIPLLGCVVIAALLYVGTTRERPWF